MRASDTEETCLYVVQCEDGLQITADDDPGVFAMTIAGAQVLAPHETATVPVWVSVNADATPGDSLRVWISQTFLGAPGGGFGCEIVVRTSGTLVFSVSAPVGPYLRQNWPNPFNPTTTIAFTIPAGSRPALLTIYDVGGRVVRQLGSYPHGTHTALWDGRNGAGAPVASGIYLCRLEGTDFALTRKMVLLR